MHPFERYLRDHDIEPLTLSVIARVRYLTVWRVMKGKPVRRSYATQMIHTATILAGVPYTGQIALTLEQPLEQTPTVLLNKIKPFK